MKVKLITASLFSVFLIQSNTANSQQIISATFENDKTMDVEFWDTPEELPKYEIRLLGSNTTISYQVSGFKLQPIYRVSNKLSLELAITGSLLKDVVEISNPEIAKRNIEILAAAHYSVYSTTSTKEKNVQVYSEPDQKGSDARLVYSMKLPIKKQKSLLIDGGLGYFSSNAQFSEYDATLDKNYGGGGMSFLSLHAGVSAQFSKNYRTKTNGVIYTKFKLTRLYANLTVAAVSNYKIYERTLTSPTSSTYQYVDRTSDFSDLKASPLGVRFGMDWSSSIGKTPLALVFGCEAGLIPSFSTGEVNHRSADGLGNVYLGLRLGVSFREISRTWTN